MIIKYLSGNFEDAKRMQLNAIPLINFLFSEVNPIPIKFALNEIGFNFGVPRLPLVEFSKNKREIFTSLLNI